MNDHSVDKTRCAAQGCPCAGSMSLSTSGTEKWFCGFHFRGANQRVTDELRRMAWLVEVIERVRGIYAKGNEQRVFEDAYREFNLAQRSDLRLMDRESIPQYIRRLESELRKCVLPTSA